MDLGLAGKQVLITGGSKGIGLALSHAFAAEGANIIIVSRDKGFDPLVRHLNARGFSVRRTGALTEAADLPKATTGLESQVARVLLLLGKVDLMRDAAVHVLKRQPWRVVAQRDVVRVRPQLGDEPRWPRTRRPLGAEARARP